MSTRDFDIRELPVEAFARQGAQAAGRWPLSQFSRLADVVVDDPQHGSGRQVQWQASGEWRSVRGGEKQIWLHLKVQAGIPLQCQRCLQVVEVGVDVSRSFLFVHGEAAAAELDSQTEDDVLPLTRALDVFDLVEDELLLALPIVPRHEPACPQPLLEAVPEDELAPAPNPFAALAALKRGTLN
jgi:uncharacterized protein